MARQAFIFFLIFSTLLANFSWLAITVGFNLNRKYITENFCVNKSRPWMHCNGHCYFMKKIKQAGENEKKQQAKDKLGHLELSFFQEPYRIYFIRPVILTGSKSIFVHYTYQYNNKYIETIFRPPKQRT